MIGDQFLQNLAIVKHILTQDVYCNSNPISTGGHNGGHWYRSIIRIVTTPRMDNKIRLYVQRTHHTRRFLLESSHKLLETCNTRSHWSHLSSYVVAGFSSFGFGTGSVGIYSYIFQMHQCNRILLLRSTVFPLAYEKSFVLQILLKLGSVALANLLSSDWKTDLGKPNRLRRCQCPLDVVLGVLHSYNQGV